MKDKILIFFAAVITTVLNIFCFILNKNYIVGWMESGNNMDLSCFVYHFIICIVLFFGTLIYAGTQLKIRGLKLTKFSVWLSLIKLVAHVLAFGIYGWLINPQGIAGSCYRMSAYLAIGTIGFIFVISFIIYIWEKYPQKET